MNRISRPSSGLVGAARKLGLGTVRIEGETAFTVDRYVFRLSRLWLLALQWCAAAVWLTSPLLLRGLVRDAVVRSRLSRRVCIRCGYPRTSRLARRCPECGESPW